MAKIKASFVREILNQLDNEEISYSRMVEMLNEKASELEGFAYEPVICDLCNFRWVAVRPYGTKELQCPNCRNTTTFKEVNDHPDGFAGGSVG